MTNQTDGIVNAVRQAFPTAVRFGVSSSDQRHSGYNLDSVQLADGTTIDSGTTFDALTQTEPIDQDLFNLSWGAFGDRNADSCFDVDMDTQRIVRD